MSRAKVLTLVFSALLLAPVCHAADCGDELLMRLFSSDWSSMKAYQTVGRTLTDKQKAVLRSLQGDAPLSPTELHAQNAALEKAGFSEKEISALRREGVLSKEVVSWSSKVPETLQVEKLALSEINNEIIRRVREGESFPYVVDSANNIRLLPKGTVPPKEGLWVIEAAPVSGEAAAAAAEKPAGFVVKETGMFEFEKGSGKFRFRATSATDLAPEETAQVLEKIRIKHGLNAENAAASGLARGRVLSCLEIISGKLAGKSFVLDGLISANLVTTSVILVSEAGGAGRLSTPEGRQMVYGDLLATNLSSLVGGMAGKVIARDDSFWSALAQRTAVGYGLTEMQGKVLQSVLENKQSSDRESDPVGEKRSEAVKDFNRKHFLFRIPVNQVVDAALLNRIPELLYDGCRTGSIQNVVISPTMIRIYERFGSTLLYYGARKHFINE